MRAAFLGPLHGGPDLPDVAGARRAGWACLLGALAACTLQAPVARAEVVAGIDVDGPTVVAFLPLSLHAASVAEATAQRELVVLAAERARACLGDRFAAYRVVFADRIVVHVEGREESFDLDTATPLAGALLLRPAANPRIVFAPGGPEGLREMMRRTVSDYFERSCGE